MAQIGLVQRAAFQELQRLFFASVRAQRHCPPAARCQAGSSPAAASAKHQPAAVCQRCQGIQGITEDSTTEVLPCKLYDAECCAAGASPAHPGCIGYVLLRALVRARLAAFTVKQKGFAAVAPLVPHLMRRIVEQAAAEPAGAELDEMAGAPVPWVWSACYSVQQRWSEGIAGARLRRLGWT